VREGGGRVEGSCEEVSVWEGWEGKGRGALKLQL